MSQAVQSQERTTVHFYQVKDSNEVVHISSDPQGNRSSFLIFVGSLGDVMKELPCVGIERYTNGAWYIRTHSHGAPSRLFYRPGESHAANGSRSTWDGRPLVELDPDDYHIEVDPRFDMINNRLRGAITITPKN